MQIVLPVAPRVGSVRLEVEVRRDPQLTESPVEVGGAVLGGRLDDAADDRLVGQRRAAVVETVVRQRLVRARQSVTRGDPHLRKNVIFHLLQELVRVVHRVVIGPSLTRVRPPHVVEVRAAAHAGHDVDELMPDRGGGLRATRERADRLEPARMVLCDGQHRRGRHRDRRQGTLATLSRAAPELGLERVGQFLGKVGLERQRLRGLAGEAGLDVRIVLVPVGVVGEGPTQRRDGPDVLVFHELDHIGLRLPGGRVLAAARAVDEVVDGRIRLTVGRRVHDVRNLDLHRSRPHRDNVVVVIDPGLDDRVTLSRPLVGDLAARVRARCPDSDHRKHRRCDRHPEQLHRAPVSHPWVHPSSPQSTIVTGIDGHARRHTRVDLTDMSIGHCCSFITESDLFG